MSDNSNSTNGNSWTLLTPEVKESGVEKISPVAEGRKIQGNPASSSAPEPLAEGLGAQMKQSLEAAELHTEIEASTQEHGDPALTQETEHALKKEQPQVKLPETSEGRAHLNAAHVNEDPASVNATVEDISSWTPDHEEQSSLTGFSENTTSPSREDDSFSDSYTHITPNSGSSTFPASDSQEGEGFRSEEESHLRKSITEESKPDVDVLESKGKEGDGLRKRKISLLGSLDQKKSEAEDDDEGEEEEFQPPQREGETVFSLNKCILGAVILLGLGTIFFSGVLMDLDDEGDIDVKELKDPTNQEWLKPDVSRDTPLDLVPPDILSKQANEDQKIAVLQAQLQQHQGELKVAQLLAEEGEKERVRREELEKENERIKGELGKLPALQKELKQENERIKEESQRAKKELEALPSLQKELEHLRVQVSQLTQSTGSAKPVDPIATAGLPSTDTRDVPPIERQGMKDKKSWAKKSGEKEHSKGEKEWKKKKSGKKEDGKEWKEKVSQGEHNKERKDWKKDKSTQDESKAWKSKGERKEWRDDKEWKKDKKREEGKIGKESEEKKAFKEWDDKKDRKEDKKWKKDKSVEQDERRGDRKDWKDTGNKKVKEEKEWKQRGERKDGKEDKEWKNEKHSDWNDRKERKEKSEKRKEWKEKEEWNGEKEWRKGKNEGKFNDKTEKKWKGEREFPKEYYEKDTEEKHWRLKEKEWSKDGERKKEGIKDEKKNKEHHQKNEGERRHNGKKKQYRDEKEWSNKEKHSYGQTEETSEHQHHHHHHHHHNQRAGHGHDNYWSRQRERIQHFHGQREACSGVADCARAEGLSPVNLRDFEAFLQGYLNKLQGPEDQTSRKEELGKLVKEFFTDGVFAHDQLPFSEFVDDVADILEDIAEGEESDGEESEDEDDDDDDDDMDEFERKAMEKFALPEEVEKVEKKGDRKNKGGKVKG